MAKQTITRGTPKPGVRQSNSIKPGGRPPTGGGNSSVKPEKGSTKK